MTEIAEAETPQYVKAEQGTGTGDLEERPKVVGVDQENGEQSNRAARRQSEKDSRTRVPVPHNWQGTRL